MNRIWSIIRPFWVFNPCPLVILNEFRDRFRNYFRFFFFFLIIKRYNLVVPKDFSAKSNFHIQNEIKYKGYRHAPLSKAKHRVNRKRSGIRAPVEHIFAFQKSSLGGKFIRTIGILRARAKIGLMNLAYNMKRYVYLTKSKPALSTA